MLTDGLLVRRLAAELHRALHGARIHDVGVLPDGRFALALDRATAPERRLLTLDPFGVVPAALLERSNDVLARRPGWPRAIADALTGTRIEGIRSRPGDRLIEIDCAVRSRFGVPDEHRLIAELVPRFGNIVLLKGETIVAACKEFTHAQNARRETIVGERYAYPPPPPPLSPLLRDTPELLERATECANGDAPVVVYRDGERIAQVYLVPLPRFAGLGETSEPALLPVLNEIAQGGAVRRSEQAHGQRIDALRERVKRRLATLAGERLALEREAADASAREELRRCGEAIYAHLTEIAPGATSFVPASDPSLTIPLDPALDAKANAAAIFKRYRKAVAKLEHIEPRLAALALEERYATEIAWELERAEPGTFEELAEAVERIERRTQREERRGSARRPAVREVRLAEDARVLVGQSPRGNVELTFRTARPDDLWFHAREVPGAHVVLRIDSRREPHPEELRAAAELAAFHSKAKGSDSVAVDYTERKYVRKQQNAPPGLVWYTHARTLTVRPRACTSGNARHEHRVTE